MAFDKRPRKIILANEKMKRAYRDYLHHADGKSEATMRKRESAIRRFEDFTKVSEFKTFDQLQAKAFKEHLLESNISISTANDILQSVKRFFQWLSYQPGYKRTVSRLDADYLNLPDHMVREAKAAAYRPSPTLNQLEAAVKAMPTETDIDLRNRALLAFLSCTGVRIEAATTLRIRNFIEHINLIDQTPRNVKTKHRKHIRTFLVPFSPYLIQIFKDWFHRLTVVLLFSEDDPIFPSAKSRIDNETGSTIVELTREYWQQTGAARKVLKAALEQVGIPGYSPHGMRNMIVKEGYKRGFSMDQMKALSQNLGHAKLDMTINTYGQLSLEEQQRIISEMHATVPENQN